VDGVIASQLGSTFTALSMVNGVPRFAGDVIATVLAEPGV
jgi:hypothetical protein